MKAVEVLPGDFENVITKAWSSDVALLDKYHICATEGVEKCVHDTVNVLNDFTHKSFKLYNLLKNDGIIGFLGVERFQDKPFLTTFFLFPEFRKEEIKKEFIDFLFNFVGTEFNTALYTKNERAIGWLIKNDAKVLFRSMNNKGEFVILNLKKESVCH